MNERRVLFLDDTHPVLAEMLSKAGYLCDYFPAYTLEQIGQILPNYQGIVLRSKYQVDRAFIDKAEHVEWFGRVGSGMENIDVDYARQKGIHCINSPEGNRDALAEHTMGMLLSLLHKIHLSNEEVHAYQWNREANRGVELRGKTVGILGFGNMGSALAERLSSFSTRILSYDKYKKNYAPSYVEESSMEDLFREVDILSVHLPLNQETHYLLSRSFFQSFQKEILVINTSRGEILCTEDLVFEIESGHIWGACLDVLEYEELHTDSLKGIKEPAPALQYLLQSPKVVLTPHVAGWSVESKVKLASVLAEKIIHLG